jgi:hypothetical protein
MRSEREPQGFRVAVPLSRSMRHFRRASMQLTAESAKAYVARLMASYGDYDRVEIDHNVVSTEGGSALKVTGRVFHSDGSATAFEWDVWRLEDGELYGEW